jgi:predicted DNA-binding transcriptional regulator AlpA
MVVPASAVLQAKRERRRGRRMLRPKEIWQRLGCGHTKFYKDYVATGRVRLVELGPNSVGAPEDEIDDLIDEIVAEHDAKLLDEKEA